MDNKIKTNIPLFFIVARGRSGTTLLSRIFDTHPNVLIPLEARFLQYVYYFFKDIKCWDKAAKDKLYEYISNFPEKINIDNNKFKTNLESLNQTANISSVIELIYLSTFSVNPKEEIIMIGDKNPLYSLYIHNILKLYPQAKFIHLCRDYRDNILSFYNVTEIDFQTKNAALLAYRWRFYNKKILLAKEKHPNQFYTIRYEDLVKEPEKHIHLICQFLDIDFKPEMLSFYKNVDEYNEHTNASFTKIHASLHQPMTTDKVDVWKSKLAKKDIIIADFITGKVGTQLGYKKIGVKPNLFLFLKSLPMIIKGWGYVWTRYWLYKMPLIMKIATKVNKVLFQNKI